MFKLYKLVLGIALSFFTIQIAAAQSVKISGVITEKATGQAIPGVSVSVKGGSNGTQTNADGKFSLSANENDILRIFSIGYNAQEIKITSGNTTLNIILEESQNALSEVVVTALNIPKEKKSLGYAVQELKSKDIAEAREVNLVNALAGKIAGVQVTNSQGDMGSSRIIIRGETSISGNNQPLFIIDGVPVDNTQTLGNSAISATSASRDYANPISDINPDDIESMSVLKGPNAAALYGSRAAAGVVLITTKKGKGSQGLGISVTSNTTFSSLLILPDYQNSYGQGANGEFSYKDGAGGGLNDGVDESWGPRLDGRLIPQFNSNGVAVPFVAHPDNVKSYFNTGRTLNNGIAFSGSNEKFDYRLSYNNMDQKGVIPNSSQSKNSFLFNSSYKITPKLTLNTYANYVNSSADNIPGSGGKRSTSTMLQFTWFGRQVDVTQLKSLYENGQNINWNNSYYSNPYFVAYENTVGQVRNRLIGSAELNYKIIDGLSANFRTGNDNYTDRRKTKIAYGTNGTPFGSYEEDAYTFNENNTEARLDYTKKLNKDFSLDVLLGGNMRTSTLENNDQLASKLAVAGLYTLSNSRDPLISYNYYTKQKVYSAFSSAQLSFRNYAYLNLTARNDWSSTLPVENRSYFYPSVNGSLILTEAFDIKSDALTFAKLRGGWSKVGKDATPYQLMNTYGFIAPFDGNPQQYANPVDLNANLKPETTKSTEAGFELGFFKNRLRFDASVYNTNSINQILSLDVSPTTGYSSKLVNGGTINNKGVELQLGITPIKTTNFTWDINTNFSSNKSRVKSLYGDIQSYVLGSDGTVQILAAVGQPYGTIFGTAYERNASGQILVDADGTPVISASKKVLGKYTPNWLGGITNSFTYKRINLSVLVDAHVGGKIYSGTNNTGIYTGVLASTLPGRGTENGGLSYYFPGNDNTARAVQIAAGSAAPGGAKVYDDGMVFNGVLADGTANSRIISASQYYKSTTNADESTVYSATYVKLREIKLGYTLPQQWIKSVGLQSATVSVVGRNLLIIHKEVPNIDPETAFNTGNGQGLEDLTLPGVRNIGFNINLKF
ncbi:TonB-linked outer membrane protein, SusC/RagA family [Pedobacter westerhofensis]|uniref:TonB-linked outer membrane protein, SusC/RagA family n=1 Tax=Pedobacter westerhofensis TaxID=425512 RepID=A0A521DIX8_9SPHI|nr:SusC/RagA family TonB-linked outer membrane protein [Pedobacter westerhofensis]SMO70870.1 TonB-linked outer membrane protein, SusC/RagA family [Pedobacter westerhofensis]